MEAVPKLPMLYCDLKISPVCPDFGTPFKRFISKHYQEDGESYDREILELETLRNNACRAPRDFTGCSLLKRYYSQIYSLQNRFSVFEPNCGVQCVWADIYSGQTVIGDLDFELACVLYNIGSLHAELGALDMRNNAESMKVACTHFQCAAWSFEHLKEDSRLYKSKDMSHDILTFFVQVMLAQAQECILEKSMLDNRKSSIVAKVAAQVVEYYSSSLLMLLQAAINTSGVHTILDIVGSKLYKEWKKFIEFKVAYYNSICSLFMGNMSEEQQKMGDRVAWYQSAEEKLNDAMKLAKQMDRNEINEALTFVADVISIKLGNARKENDFVYHEKVPTPDKLTEVKGASLVKGIPFSVCDPEISGPDIFGRLVPIEAHETASIYSAKKDEIMRTVRIKIDEKNQELASYMSSLQVDRDTLRSKDDRIPDELIEICAAMSVNPESIDEVQNALSELEEVCNDVDRAIKEAKNMIQEEEEKEAQHQEKFGKRPPSMIIMELSKELSKHEETHNKAVQSNISLRENLDKHLDDVKLLINSSAQGMASLLPSTTNAVPYDESNLQEMDRLLAKVEEMKSQRIMLENQLKETMDGDDIMKQVLAHNKTEIENVFRNEIKKYDTFIILLEQNMSAQENVLNALTKTNAKYAETRRALIENQRNRKARIESLIRTYEVFQELKSKSKKGLEFYSKFQNIVARLLARVRGVSRVQDEERTQFATLHAKKTRRYAPETNPSSITLADKLKLRAAMAAIPSTNITTPPIPSIESMNNYDVRQSNIPQTFVNYPSNGQTNPVINTAVNYSVPSAASNSNPSINTVASNGTIPYANPSMNTNSSLSSQLPSNASMLYDQSMIKVMPQQMEHKFANTSQIPNSMNNYSYIPSNPSSSYANSVITNHSPLNVGSVSNNLPSLPNPSPVNYSTAPSFSSPSIIPNSNVSFQTPSIVTQSIGNSFTLPSQTPIIQQNPIVQSDQYNHDYYKNQFINNSVSQNDMNQIQYSNANNYSPQTSFQSNSALNASIMTNPSVNPSNISAPLNNPYPSASVQTNASPISYIPNSTPNVSPQINNYSTPTVAHSSVPFPVSNNTNSVSNYNYQQTYYNNQQYTPYNSQNDSSNAASAYYNTQSINYPPSTIPINNVPQPSVIADHNQTYVYQQQNSSINSVSQYNYQNPPQIEQQNGYNSQTWPMNTVNNTFVDNTLVPTPVLTPNPITTPMSNSSNNTMILSNELTKQNNLPDLLSKMSINNKPSASTDLLNEFDPLCSFNK